MKHIALYFGMVAALVASCSIKEESFEVPQQDAVGTGTDPYASALAREVQFRRAEILGGRRDAEGLHVVPEAYSSAFLIPHRQVRGLEDAHQRGQLLAAAEDDRAACLEAESRGV